MNVSTGKTTMAYGKGAPAIAYLTQQCDDRVRHFTGAASLRVMDHTRKPVSKLAKRNNGKTKEDPQPYGEPNKPDPD